eukprot:TRINITY_DN6181_c0_g2_i1.p1 TRINITY_DN6181_c0_g2~~TRINITY_DN6181_c0_g2_i1.p1  ORF type:complete len:157 (-),score=25.62 TRINITY_DN6181_c0_g2_i1:98-568(-)
MTSCTLQKDIFTSSVVPASVDKVWAAIGRFQDLSWAGITATPVTLKQDVTQNNVGSMRMLSIGSESVVEKLEEYSSSQHYYKYSINSIAEGLLPGKFVNYHGVVKLYPVTETNHTFFVIGAQMDCEPETADAVVKSLTGKSFQKIHQNLKNYLVMP